MAYRDENGRITIDEAAANADIRKIAQAQDILHNALSGLRAAQAEAEGSKGQTAQAIYDKSQAIQKLDGSLDETIHYIRHVIAVYKAKDEALKNMMSQG